ncbi:hypothetical protein ABT237_11565 [Streptomyces sp. NPDC001581]|uniref:hypothetical protein n=1 Tax=Streptomyces sp. NPDC001581 TaxID=3154386 RepID=UPI00332AAE7A
MNTETVPGSPYAGIDGLCRHIRGALPIWARRMPGVHVHRSMSGPAEVARLVGLVAAAAEVTVLPGEGSTARAELPVAAARALAATTEGHRVDVRAELAAVRIGVAAKAGRTVRDAARGPRGGRRAGALQGAHR